MRKVAAALVLLIATNAWAYRGRPVTDLRFDGRATSSVERVATDGENFLALSSDWTNSRYHVFTQKIVDGRPAGPHHRLGFGSPRSIVWTGSEYLAAWHDGTLRIGRLSREGSLLAIAPHLSFDATNLLVNRENLNGQRLLAIGFDGTQVTVQPLDDRGSPAGARVTHATSGWSRGAGAAGDGFGLIVEDGGNLKVLLLRADGTAMPAAPIIGSRLYNTFTMMSTDGTDALILIGEDPPDGPALLKTVVVGADGIVKSQHTIYSHVGVTVDSIRPGDLLWDGSRYVVTLSLQHSDGTTDPAMVTITRTGERIGSVTWVVERPGSQGPKALAWNGHELLMSLHNFSTSITDLNLGSYCVMVDPVTLTGSTPIPFGRTPGAHDRLTIAAGDDGYLAAWFDWTDGTTINLRASRIDRSGNYLDGEGMLLATMPLPMPYAYPTAAIDGNGSQWLVVWSAGNQVRARSVSRSGVAAANTTAIGPGTQADVVWNGSQYVVLRSDRSLHRDILEASGTVASTTLLAQSEDISSDRSIHYDEPALTRLGGETIGIYVKHDVNCPFTGFPTPCGDDAALLGRRVEHADATPFVIAGDPNIWGRISIAANATQALVTWAQYQGLRGVFLPAGNPEQPGASFLIHDQGAQSSLAADGTDFVLVRDGVISQEITSSGVVSSPTMLRLEDGEVATRPVVAASATLPPLIGFIQHLPAYDNAQRAAILFSSELDDAGTPPPAPSDVCATKNDDGTVTVRWQHLPNVLGYSIELELADGTYRQIAVAPGGATRERVSLPGLEGEDLRMRAWNAGGLSAPSSTAAGTTPPRAQMRWATTACAGVPTSIEIELSGTAPFRVRWDDGLVQENVMTTTATRVVTLTKDTTFTIVSVSDATCATNEIPESVRFSVTPQPAITNQTRSVQIKRGETATLNVIANEGARFAWFEGPRGDTSHPVGTNTRSFTTPALTASTRYWVRVSNRCGSVDSQTINVSVSGKRRSTRR